MPRYPRHVPDSLRCPYCHDDVEGGLTCSGCQAMLHAECWEELGGCGTLGCGGGSAIPPEPTAPQEIFFRGPFVFLHALLIMGMIVGLGTYPEGTHEHGMVGLAYVILCPLLLGLAWLTRDSS